MHKLIEMAIPTISKSVSDQVVSQVGNIALGMMQEIGKGSSASSVSIAVSGIVTGTVKEFEKLYDIFSYTFSPSNEFSQNFQKSWLVGKNRTSLNIVNAAQDAKHQIYDYNNLPCRELAALIHGYIINNKEGAEDQIKEITQLKVFALSLLLTALQSIDQRIQSRDCRGLTMRYLLLALKNVCSKFLLIDELTKSSDDSGFAMKNLLSDLSNKINSYVEDCRSDDAQTAVQDNAQRLNENLSTLTFVSRSLIPRLLINDTPIYSLFSSEENAKLLSETTDYQSFQARVKKDGENSTDLPHYITDQKSYDFVKRRMFYQEIKDTDFDEKVIAGELEALNSIVSKLPGKNTDSLKKEYLEHLATVISAVSESYFLLQQIEIISQALNSMGESGGIWGNKPIRDTLDRATKLFSDLTGKFDTIKSAAGKLKTKAKKAKGVWVSSIQSLDTYISFITDSVQLSGAYIEQMQNALEPKNALDRFKKALIELQQAAIATKTPESATTLHLFEQTTQALEAKLVNVDNRSQPKKEKDSKEAKEEVGSNTEVSASVEHLEGQTPFIQSEAQLRTDVVQLIEALQKKGYKAEFLAQTVSAFMKKPHASKFFSITHPYQSYIIIPVQNPLKFFKVEDPFKHTLCAELDSLMRHYWTYKSGSLKTPLHADEGSIFYGKNLALGIVIGYIELIDKFQIGEIYSDSAAAVIQELGEVITTLQGMGTLHEDTDRSDHSFGDLLKSLTAIKKKYDTKKKLIDAQKLIHLNAKTIDSEIKTVSYCFDSALFEILLGKPVGYILSNSSLVTNIKESKSYEDFKKEVSSYLGKREREFIFATIATENDFVLLKSSFLESELNEGKIIDIIKIKLEKLILVTADQKKNPNYTLLKDSLIESMSKFKQLKKLIVQHKRLISISGFWGNLSGVLYTGLKKSNNEINACLTEMQEIMRKINQSAENLARATGNQATWGKNFDTLKSILEPMQRRISTVQASMSHINKSLEPSKIFGEYRNAIDLIRELKAFKEDKTEKSREILELAEHFITVLQETTNQEQNEEKNENEKEKDKSPHSSSSSFTTVESSTSHSDSVAQGYQTQSTGSPAPTHTPTGQVSHPAPPSLVADNHGHLPSSFAYRVNTKTENTKVPSVSQGSSPPATQLDSEVTNSSPSAPAQSATHLNRAGSVTSRSIDNLSPASHSSHSSRLQVPLGLPKDLSFSSMTKNQGAKGKNPLPSSDRPSIAETEKPEFSTEYSISRESGSSSPHSTVTSRSSVSTSENEETKLVEEVEKYKAKFSEDEKNAIASYEADIKKAEVNISTLKPEQVRLNSEVKEKEKAYASILKQKAEKDIEHKRYGDAVTGLAWSSIFIVPAVLALFLIPYYKVKQRAVEKERNALQKDYSDKKSVCEQYQRNLISLENRLNESYDFIESKQTEIKKTQTAAIQRIKRAELEEDRRNVEKMRTSTMGHSTFIITIPKDKVHLEEKKEELAKFNEITRSQSAEGIIDQELLGHKRDLVHLINALYKAIGEMTEEYDSRIRTVRWENFKPLFDKFKLTTGPENLIRLQENCANYKSKTDDQEVIKEWKEVWNLLVVTKKTILDCKGERSLKIFDQMLTNFLHENNNKKSLTEVVGFMPQYKEGIKIQFLEGQVLVTAGGLSLNPRIGVTDLQINENQNTTTAILSP